MKEKFRVLCIIVRLSLGLHQCQCKVFNGLEVVHTPEGFKLVCSVVGTSALSSKLISIFHRLQVLIFLILSFSFTGA